ncbi:GGDEF domain-containing protein [Luteimonas sp. RD2P54]|uniref:diguanylate cyclase n=1 Tax=Luteimonas endophytica TaxID=3042023 RepID=A0ABT6J466_9GAMM|nr:GGDEF domain-containing protein [Luteimonas endophytica]MDH5821612.1 GGDEF domain-containing protein [Luteimonas endophytica]
MVEDTQLRTIPSAGPRAMPPRASACVVVIHGDGLGRRADIGMEPVVIGRSSDAALYIPHRSVSRRHCEIRAAAGGYRVRDLGATNPTLLNERPVDDAVLADGDRITVGESVLKFIGHANIEAGYHEQLQHLAARDQLTGLHGRRRFVELAEAMIADARQRQAPLTLAVLDLDGFREINLEHGYAAGDTVLRRAGDLVQERLAEGDIAARIGEDEFAVLLRDRDSEAAAVFLDKLRRTLVEPLSLAGGTPVQLRVRTALAELGPGADGLGQLMRRVDSALS